MNNIISDMNGLNLDSKLSPIQVYIQNNDNIISGLFMPNFYMRQECCISTMILDHIELLSPKMFLQLGSIKNENSYKMIKINGKIDMNLEQWLLSKELVIFSE